jgi:hypothetical protein
MDITLPLPLLLQVLDVTCGEVRITTCMNLDTRAAGCDVLIASPRKRESCRNAWKQRGKGLVIFTLKMNYALPSRLMSSPLPIPPGSGSPLVNHIRRSAMWNRISRTREH